MNTLQTDSFKSLLDELYADSISADEEVMARFRELAPAERSALLADYVRLYGEAKNAYLAIGRPAAELLYLLARARGARRIVEFGTSFGISTLYLAAALRDGGGGQLITTELERSKAERARANLQRAGLIDLVELRVGDATETLGTIPGPIDFVYLDGAKTLYRPVLELLEPFLAERALISADNTDMDAVSTFTAYVRDPANGYHSCRVPLGDGLELSLRTRPPSTVA
jgi:predicted O-methyltransferase YrrM